MPLRTLQGTLIGALRGLIMAFDGPSKAPTRAPTFPQGPTEDPAKPLSGPSAGPRRASIHRRPYTPGLGLDEARLVGQHDENGVPVPTEVPHRDAQRLCPVAVTPAPFRDHLRVKVRRRTGRLERRFQNLAGRDVVLHHKPQRPAGTGETPRRPMIKRAGCARSSQTKFSKWRCGGRLGS